MTWIQSLAIPIQINILTCILLYRVADIRTSGNFLRYAIHYVLMNGCWEIFILVRRFWYSLTTHMRQMHPILQVSSLKNGHRVIKDCVRPIYDTSFFYVTYDILSISDKLKNHISSSYFLIAFLFAFPHIHIMSKINPW